MGDRLLGVFCFLFAGLLLQGALQIKTGLILDPLGPRAFPLAISVGMASLGLRFLLKRQPDKRNTRIEVTAVKKIAVAAVIMIVFTLILQKLGFLLSGWLLMAAFIWLMGGKPVKAAAMALGLALFCELTFRHLFGLNLPQGILGL